MVGALPAPVFASVNEPVVPAEPARTICSAICTASERLRGQWADAAIRAKESRYVVEAVRQLWVVE